jgi:hypothetical protein
MQSMAIHLAASFWNGNSNSVWPTFVVVQNIYVVLIWILDVLVLMSWVGSGPKIAQKLLSIFFIMIYFVFMLDLSKEICS